jgi:outer membrane protein
MKKMLILLLTITVAASAALAQQLTRFAVVDFAKVYRSYYTNSQAVLDLKAESASIQAESDEVQTEINRQNADILQLQKRETDAQTAGDNATVAQLKAEITQKTDSLRDYYKVKTTELANKKQQLADKQEQLTQSDTFTTLISSILQQVAESEGYTMVLDKAAKAILWYSPTVDITDKVIDKLKAASHKR